MFKITVAILWCVLLFCSAYSQNENVNKWASYKIKKEKISISLPHLPTLIENSDVCRDITSVSYFAYQKEVVYSLLIFSKAKEKFPYICPVSEKFSEKTFNLRFAELSKTFTLDNSFPKTFQGRPASYFYGKKQDIWVFNDLKNKRWIELSVNHNESKVLDNTNFVDSLKFDAGVSGIEIGKGSEITLGDDDGELVNPISMQENASKKLSENSDVQIIAKPRASYTDAARTNQIQGTVTLSVTLQSNGSIGKITTIKGLGGRLTEEATKSAKKIVFLPQKRNGISETVTREVQYGFTIY